jgi:hypothetical protein
VRAGIVRLCVPTHHIVLTALEAMHASNNKMCPVHLSEKSVQEIRAKEDLSFLRARQMFLKS